MDRRKELVLGESGEDRERHSENPANVLGRQYTRESEQE